MEVHQWFKNYLIAYLRDEISIRLSKNDRKTLQIQIEHIFM